MTESMIIKEEVHFKSSIEKVWDLLINPEMTQQYMFGCKVISDWKIGSPVFWKGQTENGEEIVYVKGKVLEYEEGKRVSSTTFDPNSGMADIPENHVTLSYEIKAQESGTLLTIIQGDFSKAAEGQKRYDESKSGWEEMVIPKMIELLNE